MAINVTLQQLSTLNNNSILTQNNTNFSTIQNALPDALSRSGVSPNQMQANLDMNHNQILNLPPPSTVNSPARLVDVATNPTITVPPTGTSGATVPLLNGNNTWSGTNTFGTVTNTSTTTSSLAVTSNPFQTQPPVVYTGTAATITSTTSTFNSSAAFTATLPSPTTNSGQWLFMKTIVNFTVSSASANVTPLAGGAASTSILAATAGKWAWLQSDGTLWNIMASN